MSFRIALTVLLALSLSYASALRAQTKSADALVAKGQRQFLLCLACHDIGETTIVKIGPNLKGIFGRKVASVEGFKYSPALKEQSFIWTEAELDRWLEKPTAISPGTTMAIIGMPNPADRKAVIAYMLKKSQ